MTHHSSPHRHSCAGRNPQPATRLITTPIALGQGDARVVSSNESNGYLRRTGVTTGWAMALLLLVLTGCTDPHSDGRAGNSAYRADAFDQARGHFSDALADLDTTASGLRADLLFNAAASHAAEASAQQSVALYDSSRSAARSDASRTNGAAFNGGVAAHSAQDLEGARSRFRLALLADADDMDARHNWEWIARQMDRQQQQGGQNPPPDPSDFARRLKEQADALVAQERYAAAYALMQDGLARDETVAAFNTFISRVGSVAQIDSAPTGTPR